MLGHTARGQIASKVNSSIDSLIMRFRHIFTVEHKDDGTHQGVTYTGPVTQITIVNGIVTKVS